ncbi:DUF2314 domain-containing protein [Ferruginibacter sp. SUN106]|uniref:DUF2314 domain-containing protein n=1 Tax=Ferruginibacter sp. SUN106 TaxID=2978348 RepID=UPI003D36C705
MKTRLYPICCILLLAASCKPKDQRIVDHEKHITTLPAGDAKFLALKDTAQKYMDEFITGFKINGHNDNYAFTIKSNYSDKEINEHMWSAPIAFTNGVFTCVFVDSAYNVQNVKTGDTVRVNQKDIEDWTIYNYSDNTQRGYFSEKYLRGE